MPKPLFIFLLLLIAIGALSALGPAEKSLGSNVRSVYLHGAWVWTSLLGFSSAGFAAILGLVTNREEFHQYSTALGRAGLFFWVTYLPLSLWAMQLNWNGLFLEEPRWRVGMDFAIVGLLFQLALVLIQRPIWGSILNLIFGSALVWSLANTEQVMHPSSPILTSTSLSIKGFFALLLALCLAAGWQLATWVRLRFAVQSQ